MEIWSCVTGDSLELSIFDSQNVIQINNIYLNCFLQKKRWLETYGLLIMNFELSQAFFNSTFFHPMSLHVCLISGYAASIDGNWTRTMQNRNNAWWQRDQDHAGVLHYLMATWPGPCRSTTALHGNWPTIKQEHYIALMATGPGFLQERYITWWQLGQDHAGALHRLKATRPGPCRSATSLDDNLATTMQERYIDWWQLCQDHAGALHRLTATRPGPCRSATSLDGN